MPNMSLWYDSSTLKNKVGHSAICSNEIDPAILKRLRDETVIDIIRAEVDYHKGVANLQAEMWGQVCKVNRYSFVAFEEQDNSKVSIVSWNSPRISMREKNGKIFRESHIKRTAISLPIL